MRTVIVRDAMRIPLGKQGENNAVRVVWPGIAEKYAKLYGDGRFELVVVQKGKAYPAVVNVDGADLVWDVLAADVATAEVGSLELIYYVGDTIAKSQTWETVVVASKSAGGMTEPPEDPARAWFDAIKRQIGDLSKLTTKAKENLVAAINEAARTGSGGGGTVEMRVDGGYIQYSTDGVTWENLIAVASLEGKPGKDGAPGAPGTPGAPGKDGEPGKDGHTPKIAATKTGKTTSITADGVEIAQIKDGEDAAADPSLGITGAQVGQIAKITAVDTEGKPTKWEPVDMDAEKFPKFTKLLTHTITQDELESSPIAFVWGTAQIPNLNDFNVFVLSIARPDGVQITFSKWVRLKINNMIMGNICGTSKAAAPQYVITANRLFGVWISGTYYNPQNISVPVLVPPQSSNTYQSNSPVSEPVTSIGFSSYDTDYGLTAGVVVEIWGAK